MFSFNDTFCNTSSLAVYYWSRIKVTRSISEHAGEKGKQLRLEVLYFWNYLVIRTAVSWWEGWASSRTFCVCCHKQKLRNVVAALKLMTGPSCAKKYVLQYFAKHSWPLLPRSLSASVQCVQSHFNRLMKWQLSPSYRKHVLAILPTLWSKQNLIRPSQYNHPVFKIKTLPSKNSHILNHSIIRL